MYYDTYYLLFFAARILYSNAPASVSTVTVSPFLCPRIALPTGDSFEILPLRLLASVEPTILYSTSSSNSTSRSVTVQPMLMFFVSCSSVTTSAFLRIFSISSIRASISRCSSFAASYSAFSERSPCSLKFSFHSDLLLLIFP